MSYGPVEVMVVRFPGSRFNGQIAPALKEVVDQGIIRIVDLVFVSKDDAGDIVELELSDLTDDEASALDPITGGEMSPLLNDEDLAMIEEELQPGSSAAVLVIEHLWASRISAALADSAGEVIMSERIPGPVVEAVMAALEA